MRAVAGPSEPPTRPRTAGSAAHMRQWRGCAGRGAGAARQCAQRSGWACAGRALMRLSSGMTTPREEKLCARPACGQDTPSIGNPTPTCPMALMANKLRVAAVSCGARKHSCDSASLPAASCRRALATPHTRAGTPLPVEQHDRPGRSSQSGEHAGPAAAGRWSGRRQQRMRPPRGRGGGDNPPRHPLTGAAPPCATGPRPAAHVLGDRCLRTAPGARLLQDGHAVGHHLRVRVARHHVPQRVQHRCAQARQSRRAPQRPLEAA